MGTKKRWISVGPLVLLALAGVRGSLHGWGATWMGANLERLVNASRWKAGPLMIDAVFRLSNVGYDSNIYYGSPEGAVADVAVTSGPDVRVYLPLKKKVVLELSEYPRYMLFLQNDKERGWNNAFRTMVHFVFNRFYFVVGEELTSTRERWTTEADFRVRRRVSILQGTLLWQYARAASLSLKYRRPDFRHANIAAGQGDLRERLNRTEDYVNLTLYFQTTSRLRYSLDGEYGTYSFSETSSLKNSRSMSVSGGFEFLQIGALQGRASLGYKWFNILNPLAKDYQGLVGDTGLVLKPTKLIEINGTFARDIQFSAWYNNTYFIQTIYSAGISRLLSRTFSITYRYIKGRNFYPQIGFDGTGGAVQRTDLYETHTVGTRLWLNKRTLVEVLAGFAKRDSNFDWSDDQRFTCGFNLTYDF